MINLLLTDTVIWIVFQSWSWVSQIADKKNTVVIWTEAPICYLDMLGKLQKQVCEIVGPLLAASFDP